MAAEAARGRACCSSLGGGLAGPAGGRRLSNRGPDAGGPSPFRCGPTAAFSGVVGSLGTSLGSCAGCRSATPSSRVKLAARLAFSGGVDTPRYGGGPRGSPSPSRVSATGFGKAVNNGASAFKGRRACETVSLASSRRGSPRATHFRKSLAGGQREEGQTTPRVPNEQAIRGGARVRRAVKGRSVGPSPSSGAAGAVGEGAVTRASLRKGTAATLRRMASLAD